MKAIILLTLQLQTVRLQLLTIINLSQNHCLNSIFSKGPMILSFDVTMNNLTSPFYLVLRSSEDADTDMLGIIRIQNTGRICGYTKEGRFSD